jgi:hypothetical protein
MEPDFTSREIKHYFEEIRVALNKQDAVLLEIKTQVIKTNGRVSLLEMWKEGLMAKVTTVFASISIFWVLFKEFILK